MTLNFKYSNALTTIENSISVKNGDTLVFSEKRYASNCLIGISGMYEGRYINQAKMQFNEEFPKGIKVNNEFWHDERLIDIATKYCIVLN